MRDSAVSRPDDDACLRASEQLVTAETARGDPGVDTGADGRLVERAEPRWTRLLEHVAATEVLDDRDVKPTADLDDLLKRGPLCEPLDLEVGRVDAQNQRSAVGDRGGVVRRPGPVRRADLTKSSSRLLENLRDAKASADFDQLATRDDHLAPCRERRENQQHCGRVVVYDGRGFGSRQAREKRCGVLGTGATGAADEVVFEVCIPGGNRGDAIDGCPC